MGLRANEIRPGIVAYFSAGGLRSYDIEKKSNTPPRDGPFLCYQVSRDGQSSLWAEITKERGNGRYEIRASERRGDEDSDWIKKPQYLNGARTTFRGANEVFVKASESVDMYESTSRPRVTEAELQRVRQFVTDSGGFRTV